VHLGTAPPRQQRPSSARPASGTGPERPRRTKSTRSEPGKSWPAPFSRCGLSDWPRTARCVTRSRRPLVRSPNSGSPAPR
jgi:hypothetical protein